jgi:hypothetical protein
MASVRPIPTSYYYSGQGRLGIGERNATTGELSNVIFVGNVTSLSIDISVDKFEHKESMSGQRAIDLTIIKEKNATFKFTSESLSLDALKLGLYGDSASTSGATVTDEPHNDVKLGTAIPLKHPKVSSVVVKKGATTLTEGTDYQVDEGFGTVYVLTGGTLIAGDDVTISYTYAASTDLEAFTVGTPPERYLRFEGLNTVDGTLRLLEIPRAAFDPLTGLEYINEELGSGEFAGNCLPDLTIVTAGKSQYFREKRVAG